MIDPSSFTKILRKQGKLYLKQIVNMVELAGLNVSKQFTKSKNMFIGWDGKKKVVQSLQPTSKIGSFSTSWIANLKCHTLRGIILQTSIPTMDWPQFNWMALAKKIVLIREEWQKKTQPENELFTYFTHLCTT
jgi:hypothetical protein